MTARGSAFGWLLAASSAAVLLTGATALAITALPPQPLMLDLGQMPAAAPALAAITEATPQIVDEAPEQNEPSMPDTAPTPPVAQSAPFPPFAAPAISQPPPDVATQSDIALPRQEAPPKPPEVTPAPQPKAEKVAKTKTVKPQPKTGAKPQKPSTKAAEATPKEAPAKPAAAAGSSAPQKGQKAKGGAPKMSSAAYAKAVMKKVRATKKKSGAGKGMAVVGFTVAKNGGLAGVKLLRSSGNAALDQIAVSHITRAAPFPVPPEGAGRSFSFEFVGK